MPDNFTLSVSTSNDIQRKIKPSTKECKDLKIAGAGYKSIAAGKK